MVSVRGPQRLLDLPVFVIHSSLNGLSLLRQLRDLTVSLHVLWLHGPSVDVVAAADHDASTVPLNNSAASPTRLHERICRLLCSAFG
jgi:hypothetical protein